MVSKCRWLSMRSIAVLISLQLAVPARSSKYLLFTSQRSGSTWFCDVLNRQNGVQCGVSNSQSNPHLSTRTSEMMIHYSYMKNRVVGGYNYSNITWAKWRTDCEEQFAKLAREVGSDDAVALGFKLMYDQVPPRLVDQFVKYAKENDITVVHLEREAVVLRVSSGTQSKLGQMHERDEEHASAVRASTPMFDMPFATLDKAIKAKMTENLEWTKRLKYAPNLRYYHVSYEQLTGRAAVNYLRSVISFVIDSGVDVDLRNISMESELKQLHESSCRSRIAPSLYAQMQSSGSDTNMDACRLLDAREDLV